jgi:hypothetical protein
MKYLMIGRRKVANGMWKMIVNGKQKTQIDSSIILRRPKMIKKYWKKLKEWFWNGFYGRN